MRALAAIGLLLSVCVSVTSFAEEPAPVVYIATGSALAAVSLEHLAVERSYFTADAAHWLSHGRIAVHPDRPLAYLRAAEGIDIFDLGTGRRSGHVPVELSSVVSSGRLRISGDGNRLYVLDESGLFVIDTENERVIQSSGVGPGAADLALTSDSLHLWVVNEIGRLYRYSVLEGLEFDFDVSIPADAHSLAVSPDDALLLISIPARRAVDVIARNGAYRGSIVVEGRPGEIVFSSSSEAYVAVAGLVASTIDVLDIDAMTIRRSWPLDFLVAGIVLAPDGRLLLLPSSHRGACSVVAFDPETGEITGHIDMPEAIDAVIAPPPPAIAPTPTPTPGAAPAAVCAYLSHPHSNVVSVVDVGRSAVLGVIPVPRTNSLAHGAAPDRILATSSWGIALTPIDLSSSSALDPLPIFGGEVGRLEPVPGGSTAVTTLRRYGSECSFASEVDLASGRQTTLLGPQPHVHRIAVEPGGHFAYALDVTGNRVEVASWPDLEPIGEIATPGFRASDIAFHLTRARAYVVGPPAVEGDPVSSWADRPGRVTVVDTETQQAVAEIPTGYSPVSPRLSPDGAVLYVANANSGDVTATDTATDSVRATIGVGDHPIAIAFTPDGATALVSSQPIAVVEVAIDTVVATIPIHERAEQMLTAAVPGGCPAPAEGPLPTPMPTLPSQVACVGDCDGVGGVTVDELVRAVRMSSTHDGHFYQHLCPSLLVCPGINCMHAIRFAVRNALRVCPG